MITCKRNFSNLNYLSTRVVKVIRFYSYNIVRQNLIYSGCNFGFLILILIINQIGTTAFSSFYFLFSNLLATMKNVVRRFERCLTCVVIAPKTSLRAQARACLSNFSKDKSNKNISENINLHGSNAEALIEKVPVIEIKGDVAACDGGGEALGHPISFIKLNRLTPEICKYCGLRYIMAPGNHYHH